MSFDTSQAAYLAFRAIVAERTNPLVAWTGSGLSAAAGFPTWDGLKERLLDATYAKADGFEGDDRVQLRAAADAIQAQPNNWIAFKMLRDSLGKTSYRDTIRESFAASATVDIPKTYRQLWRLRLRGILNLNIDRLAARALSAESAPGALVTEYSGQEIRDLGQVLGGHRPFVANLHGSVEESTTWVFTHDELKDLTANQAYARFIQTCLATHTVLFIGISADDLAVGGHLRRLADEGVQTATHYWLTDRTDRATDYWAEQAGIRLIRYRATGDDHRAVNEFFQDLQSYVPQEPVKSPPPVALSELAGVGDDLPLRTDIETWDAERIRVTLNAHAQELLAGDDDNSYRAYDDFASEYSQAIYRAWYTSTNPGENSLLGYTLEVDVARGAFGRVYRAADSNGHPVAVKVLLEEVRKDPDLLKSFRRGVRSMRILHKAGVEGMVSYLEASEIPAFVVMEWIEGPNLTEARQSKFVDDWHDILKIGTELASIIRKAHALPERVLHRDIRPSNVMLKGYYADAEAWEVVVLDFDLSWHKGAYERSVLHTTSAGFMAPEQIQPTKGASTRHAAVDSFGIGMTLLYLCSGKEPLPDQQRHAGWEQVVRTACEGFAKAEWRSLPERFARLVLAATRDQQAARWDLAEILDELSQLRTAIDSPGNVSSPELLAEELAAHCAIMTGYEWDPDRLAARHRLPTGLEIELATEPKERRIGLRIAWSGTGAEDRRSVGKYITGATKAVAGQLTASGWGEMRTEIEASSMSIEAALAVDSLKGRIPETARVIDEATRRISFDR